MIPEYEKILNMPHHVSPDRAHMPRTKRAAQFAPFQALSGYDKVIEETQRLTQQFRELGEDEVAALDRKLVRLRQRLAERPWAELTYFVPDDSKSGGAYRSVAGTVKRIDEFKRLIIMDGGEKIPIDQISAVQLDERGTEK